jgi:hypothetical protein
VNYIYVQRCLSTAIAMANLCGPVVTRLKTGKLARSPSFEELSSTSHLRARCGPLYHRVLVFCITSAMFENFEHFTIYVLSYVIQELL